MSRARAHDKKRDLWLTSLALAACLMVVAAVWRQTAAPAQSAEGTPDAATAAPRPTPQAAGEADKPAAAEAQGAAVPAKAADSRPKSGAVVRERTIGALAHRTWATPLKKPGLPNLNKVTEGLYRGAQPTAEGMGQLKAMGIKTVINLRAFHTDRDEIGNLKFDYVAVPMNTWHPEDEDVAKFLKVVTDKSRMPVFVHCQHGADRTGTMCAIYRIAVGGWTKEDAIKEMTEGGYGFHPIWQNLVKYIRDLDVEKIKRQAGIGQPAKGGAGGEKEKPPAPKTERKPAPAAL